MGDSAGDDALARRVQRLENVITFQERLITDLNAIVVDFTGRVERLEKAEARRSARGDEPEVGPFHDPPPSLTSEA